MGNALHQLHDEVGSAGTRRTRSQHRGATRGRKDGMLLHPGWEGFVVKRTVLGMFHGGRNVRLIPEASLQD